MTLEIRRMEASDAEVMSQAFCSCGWHKPQEQFECYLNEQNRGLREVLVAWNDAIFAGYLTIVWQADYLPFREAGIPEIMDFNVLPLFQRQGIGSRLLDAAEARIWPISSVVGIEVGLYADYGAAQRLYAKRGYIPDGRGLLYEGKPVTPGTLIRVDDELTLALTLQLPAPASS